MRPVLSVEEDDTYSNIWLKGSGFLIEAYQLFDDMEA